MHAGAAQPHKTSAKQKCQPLNSLGEGINTDKEALEFGLLSPCTVKAFYPNVNNTAIKLSELDLT